MIISMNAMGVIEIFNRRGIMNLRQLELFVAVVEQGSVSRGAERVLRTQSTVSQQLAALEVEVGLRLLNRTSRGVEPTVAGRLFLVRARQVLHEIDAMNTAMQVFRGSHDVVLSFGASNIPATYLIPRLLPELARRHSGITLDVHSADSRAILDQLLTGIFELAVVGSHFDLAGCEFLPLTTDLLVLVVAPGHPWSRFDTIALDELCNEPLLLRESGSGSGQALQAALQREGLDSGRLKVGARLGSNEAIKEAVAGGCGGAFLSELSIRREVARGELVVVAVAGFVVTRRLWLVRRSGRTLAPAAETVAALLQELYPLT